MTSVIPPAFRAERHFAGGAAYLRGLADGTQITVSRLDGATFDLTLRGGLLRTELPASQPLADGKKLKTPLGYILEFADEARPGLRVTAPNGAWAQFQSLPTIDNTIVTESDGNLWYHNYAAIVLRLGDGTRLDLLDEGTTWEALTLRGERFSFSLTEKTWTSLPKLPSPPLVPELKSFYVAGDGNDWYKPLREDHLVFGWDWFVTGLAIERAIADVSDGYRRQDLDLYFNELDRPQLPSDMAGCILGRRFALGGGDSLTFTEPGKQPLVAYLLPGPSEPDHAEPKRWTPQIPGLRQR